MEYRLMLTANKLPSLEEVLISGPTSSDIEIQVRNHVKHLDFYFFSSIFRANKSTYLKGLQKIWARIWRGHQSGHHLQLLRCQKGSFVCLASGTRALFS